MDNRWTEYPILKVMLVEIKIPQNIFTYLKELTYKNFSQSNHHEKLKIIIIVRMCVPLIIANKELKLN